MFWLKRQLNALRRTANPSREFETALWSKLSAEFDRRHVVSPVHRPAWKFAAVGVCALALFVSTGMGVYAYESPDVSVGHPLFGVKRGIEQVEGQFARTPEERARFHQRMLNRRLAEAERAIAKPARAIRILEMAADELDMSLQEFAGELRDPATREQVLDELSAVNERYAEVIERVGEHVREFRRAKPEEFRELIRRFRQVPPPSEDVPIHY